MNQIDAKSVQFLNAARYFGGEANITEIRKATGLNRNETNYRFRKLEDMGLIEVTHEPSPGDHPDRKVAHLTGQARQELERGLGSATTAGLIIHDDADSHEVSEQEFRAMQDELRRLREAQKASAYDSKGSNESVSRDDFEEFEEYVYEWMEAAERYLRAIRAVIERYVPGVDSMSDHFDEVSE